MKLRIEISIDADLDTVWSTFDHPDNMGRWQRNFHSYAHLPGDPGKVGSVSELTFNENGKIVALTETITERRDNNLLTNTYESARGKTTIVNRFEKNYESTTRWTSWCNFTFGGFMKLMSPFISGLIRIRTEGDMQRLKLVVETDDAGATR
jgi:hypothetical protein